MADERQGLQSAIKTLHLKEPFRIAHGSSDERRVLRVAWGDAIGEAPFVPYYPDDPEAVLQWLRETPWKLGTAPAAGPAVGRLALDVLWHDWQGKRQNKPLWQLLGTKVFAAPPGCRSLGIPDDLDAFREKVRQIAGQFRVMKLKLGSGNIDFDEAIAAYAREAAPKVTFFADANGGWSPSDAAAIISRLLKRDILFVEQPVHHQLGLEGWRELRAALPSRSMPLFADESAQHAGDVAGLAEYVDGINVKLLKCGGLAKAVDMIARARACRLKVMLGCMIESGIGITAAAHLAPLVDWIDLDGHLYVADDDVIGVRYDEQGSLIMPTRAGVGAVLRPVSQELGR